MTYFQLFISSDGQIFFLRSKSIEIIFFFSTCLPFLQRIFLVVFIRNLEQIQCCYLAKSELLFPAKILCLLFSGPILVLIQRAIHFTVTCLFPPKDALLRLRRPSFYLRFFHGKEFIAFPPRPEILFCLILCSYLSISPLIYPFHGNRTLFLSGFLPFSTISTLKMETKLSHVSSYL